MDVYFLNVDCSNGNRLSFLISLAGLCLCGVSSTTFAQSNPALARVRAGLEQTLLTLETLAVDFEVTDARAAATSASIELPQEPVKFYWGKSGRRDCSQDSRIMHQFVKAIVRNKS